MKITYKMTADDFEKAWEYKNKVCLGKGRGKMILTLAVISVILSALISYFGAFYGVICVIVCCALSATAIFLRKRNIENIFRASPVFKSEFSLFTEEKGLRIINKYEDIFVEWSSLYSVRETKTHFILIPVFIKGAYAVSKEKAGSELTNIIEDINKNMKVKEAVK